MKTQHIVAIVALLVGLFVVSLVVDRNSSLDRVRWVAALDWTVTATGIGIAVISSFRLLQAAFQGAKLPQILPPTLSLFAGLMLYQRFWTIHIAFASILVCWLIIEHLRPADKKSGD